MWCVLCQGIAESPLSVFYGWKNFCARYFRHWCKNNEPYGLFVRCSTGAVVLLRKYSVSVFRSLEKVELLIGGMLEIHALKSFFMLLKFWLCSGRVTCFHFHLGSSDELAELVSDELEREILFEVLKCINSISQQLGEAASAVFYESVVGASIISSEDIIPRLLKILETGYSSSITRLNISGLGPDVAKEKELADHRNFRKNSIHMLLSLHTLSQKAASWDKVLNVIESYLQFLVPRRIIQNLDVETILQVNTSIIIQATSQIAKVMFESALDILLFISYLVDVGGQVSFPFLLYSSSV